MTSGSFFSFGKARLIKVSVESEVKSISRTSNELLSTNRRE